MLSVGHGEKQFRETKNERILEGNQSFVLITFLCKIK
jgi:hypothetical protein